MDSRGNFIFVFSFKRLMVCRREERQKKKHNILILVPLDYGRVLSSVPILFDFHFGTHTGNRMKVNLKEMDVEEDGCNRSGER